MRDYKTKKRREVVVHTHQGQITEINLAHLPYSERAVLAEIAFDAQLEGITSHEELVDFAERNVDVLPPTLRDALDGFADPENQSCVLRVMSLPFMFRVPRTPENHASAPLYPRITVYAALIACYLGDPVGYKQERNGGIFQSLIPTRESASRQTAESSLVTLTYHTESAFNPNKPGLILLMGMRQDHDRCAMTPIATVSAILRALRPETIQRLSSPEYRTGIDEAFVAEDAVKGGLGELMPILSGNPVFPELCYDLDLMEAQNADAERALVELGKVIDQVALRPKITAGSVLVIKNKHAVHARTAFVPRWDGWDRWLVRVHIVPDRLVIPDLIPGTRVIDSRFSNFTYPSKKR